MLLIGWPTFLGVATGYGALDESAQHDAATFAQDESEGETFGSVGRFQANIMGNFWGR